MGRRQTEVAYASTRRPRRTGARDDGPQSRVGQATCPAHSACRPAGARRDRQARRIALLDSQLHPDTYSKLITIRTTQSRCLTQSYGILVSILFVPRCSNTRSFRLVPSEASAYLRTRRHKELDRDTRKQRKRGLYSSTAQPLYGLHPYSTPAGHTSLHQMTNFPRRPFPTPTDQTSFTISLIRQLHSHKPFPHFHCLFYPQNPLL